MGVLRQRQINETAGDMFQALASEEQPRGVSDVLHAPPFMRDAFQLGATVEHALRTQNTREIHGAEHHFP